jgi:hypothetical protein
MVEKHVRVPTPYPCTPDILVKALVGLTAPLTSYNRISDRLSRRRARRPDHHGAAL